MGMPDETYYTIVVETSHCFAHRCVQALDCFKLNDRVAPTGKPSV